MSEAEFSRPVRARHLPAGAVELSAEPAEREALARRFGVVAVDTLETVVRLEADGDAILASGELTAELVQTCAVSGDEFPVQVREPVHLRFVRPRQRPPEEDLELPDEDADEIEYEGDSFDLGEAIAQTLGLAIDPYATGPKADAARAKAGIAGDDQTRGPLAELLEGLRKE